MLGQHWDKHAHMDTYKKSLETRDLSFFNIQTDTQFEQEGKGKQLGEARGLRACIITEAT